MDEKEAVKIQVPEKEAVEIQMPEKEAVKIQVPSCPDKAPIVHSILAPSTRTWQYVVADPCTQRCVIIDPTRDYCEGNMTAVSTTAADSILTLVQQNKYVVQLILETDSAISGLTRYRSAAWYLRMQLAELQGKAPELCSAAAITSMTNAWRRRHGADSEFKSKLRSGISDGEIIKIGRMRVHCLHVPSYGTPHRRAYSIGTSLFGAHSLASLAQTSTVFKSTTYRGAMDPETATITWKSMMRILSFPTGTKLYEDLGDICFPPSSSVHLSSGTGPEGSRNYQSVGRAKEKNEYVELSAAEFILRCPGQQQEQKEMEERKK